MHSAPVHRARLRASVELWRLNRFAPTSPGALNRADSPKYTGLLFAVNNDISRSGQTPLFQAVSTN